MERIGLIAGAGDFPAVLAQEARKKGAKIIAFAVKDVTSPAIADFADRVHWIDPHKFSIQGFVFTLIAERIRNMIMVGKIDKSLAFAVSKGNKDVEKVLSSARDNMDYSILEEVTRRFSQIGIKIIDGLEYLKDLLPEKGALTKRLLSPEEAKDVEFGVNIAREITRLDIGQTITVKNRAVVTVEAMEGTDNAIRRAYELVKGGFAVVKVARPRQDMRWDVPLVGMDTIKTLKECNSPVLAIESGKMFISEKAKTVNEADTHNITIVAV